MKSNGREIYNEKVASGMWQKHIRNCVNDMARRDIAQKKIQIKNSDEYKNNQKARDIAQMFTNVQNSLIEELKLSSTQLADDIYEFIKSELSIFKSSKQNDYFHDCISDERINEIINVCLPALIRLKNLSSFELIKTNVYNAYTDYEKLFNNLIDLDMRFAMFAPVNCVERICYKKRFESLPTKLKTKIESERSNQEEITQDYVLRAERSDSVNATIQRMVDKVEEDEFKARIKTIESIESLSRNVFKFVVERLGLQNYDEKTLKLKDINQVLTMCKPAISTLNKYSNDEKLNEIAGWDKFNPYTELFNNLININIRFAFFAPKESLNRFGIDYNRMSDKEKDVMFDVLNRYSLWDNEEFYENYRSLFIFQLSKNNAKNEI